MTVNKMQACAVAALNMYQLLEEDWELLSLLRGVVEEEMPDSAWPEVREVATAVVDALLSVGVAVGDWSETRWGCFTIWDRARVHAAISAAWYGPSHDLGLEMNMFFGRPDLIPPPEFEGEPPQI